MQDKITVYSTNCPKCKVLIKKLQDSGLKFEVIDDEDVVVQVANFANITSAPFMVINNTTFYDFAEAIDYVNIQMAGK